MNNITVATTTTTAQTTVKVHPANFHQFLQPLEELHVAVLSLLLAACLFGNMLVITAICRTQKLRIPSHILIINLSVCDMLTSVSAIPLSLIIYFIYHGPQAYPYGEVGCKILWPFSTYTDTGSAFTLAAIAVERYLNISKDVKLSKISTFVIIGIIHAVAMITVIPYGLHLKYAVGETEKTCGEEWSHHWHQKSYTISLFFVQYLVPLTIMVFFYFITWRKLNALNTSVIKMSEEYERQMDWQDSCAETYKIKTALDNFTNTDERTTGNSYVNIREISRFNRSKFSSQVSYMRHQQSLRTLKMFTVVVVVFAFLALPHQLSWFLLDFSHLPLVADYIFMLLTFVSRGLNCWIYSWFNNDIRQAYIRLICRPCTDTNDVVTPHNDSNSTIVLSPSLYNRRKEEQFDERKINFDRMFKEHSEGKESMHMTHLYDVSDVEEKSEEDN